MSDIVPLLLVRTVRPAETDDDTSSPPAKVPRIERPLEWRRLLPHEIVPTRPETRRMIKEVYDMLDPRIGMAFLFNAGSGPKLHERDLGNVDRISMDVAVLAEKHVRAIDCAGDLGDMLYHLDFPDPRWTETEVEPEPPGVAFSEPPRPACDKGGLIQMAEIIRSVLTGRVFTMLTETGEVTYYGLQATIALLCIPNFALSERTKQVLRTHEADQYIVLMEALAGSHKPADDPFDDGRTYASMQNVIAAEMKYLVKAIKDAANTALDAKNDTEFNEVIKVAITLVALLFAARDAYNILSANILFDEREAWKKFFAADHEEATALPATF